MKNPRYDIYKSFGAALQGITQGGQAVNVYANSPQKEPQGIYILIGTITTVQDGTKQEFGHDCTIDIQVIDNSRANYITPLAIENVTTSVMEALMPTTLGTVLMDDFYMVWMRLTNTFSDSGLFDDGHGTRNILQYAFEIYEKQLTGIWLLITGFWDDNGIWDDTANWID